MTVSRIASREIRARTRVLVESEPVPFPPKSVLELEAIKAGGEATCCGWLGIEVELELPIVLLDVEAPTAAGAFLGETTLATCTSLRPTVSSVISSKSKLGRRCGDSTFACPSWIFGGGVRGRVMAAGIGATGRLTMGLCGGESVLSSSEWALDPDSDAGERGVATLALCEKKGDVKPMVGREKRDCSLTVGCGRRVWFCH